MQQLCSSLRLLFIMLLTPFIAHSAYLVQLDNEQQYQRFYELTHQLRCQVCQNESIAESDADLANDLKQIVAEQIKAGKTNKEITDFLVARYGEFILYKPRFEGSNLWLWLGPFFVLLLTLIFIIIKIRHNQTKAPAKVNADIEAQAHALLNNDNKDST